MINRPKFAGHYTTTPKSKVVFRLLGTGLRTGAITLTRDETTALNKLYGLEPEKPNKRPPEPKYKEPEMAPGANPYDHRRAVDKAQEEHKRAVELWETWTDPRPFMQAGADRNMVRHAEHDGMRLIAWLAKYVPAGEDPLKTLVQLTVDAGYDVDPSDIAWVENDGEDEEAAE